MYIHEAINARTAQKPFITRKARSCLTDNPCSAAIKIQPTNSPGGCILHSEFIVNQQPCWPPRLEDLIADDWEPVGL